MFVNKLSLHYSSWFFAKNRIYCALSRRMYISRYQHKEHIPLKGVFYILYLKGYSTRFCVENKYFQYFLIVV